MAVRALCIIDLSCEHWGLQLAVLEARSKGWGRIGQAPKGRSQSAPRGVPRSRIAPAARPASITVCTALLLFTVTSKAVLGHARGNVREYGMLL